MEGYTRMRVVPADDRLDAPRGVARRLIPHHVPAQEGRCKATWKREFKLPWREAGSPNYESLRLGAEGLGFGVQGLGLSG